MHAPLTYFRVENWLDRVSHGSVSPARQTLVLKRLDLSLMVMSTFARITRICFRILYYKYLANKIPQQMRGFMSKINSSTQNLDLRPGSHPIPGLFGFEKIKLYPVSQTRQVLLIGNGNAFSDGIANLLNRQPGMSIRHEIYVDNYSILRDVLQNEPDVVVLVLPRQMNLESIVEMLMSIQVMSHLRLVILGLETPWVKLYEMGNIVDEIKSLSFTLTKVDDFLFTVNKNWDEILYSVSI
jgi:hypothetical protein